jgi:NAD(P)-dependent dehydrogenase (short-subunit alcohol dehydrogenase family)
VKAQKSWVELPNSDRVHLLHLDLESLDSVRACAKEFQAQSFTLNILVCNASVMVPPEGRTQDGFETQLETNRVAHPLLFNVLTDDLVSSAT